ncbi:MAG: hypothetical protein AAGB04_00295 [Pseudomonadota bacterium]
MDDRTEVMSDIDCLMSEVVGEMKRATAKFPTWPDHGMHASAIVAEEAGELHKATLEHTYEPNKSTLEDVRKEAIQTAAMCFRFLMSMDEYHFVPCSQHKQGGF